MNQSQIIETIKAEMAKQGLTAYGLGKKSGLLSDNIYNALRQKNTPTLSTLLDICNALGLEVIVKPSKNSI